MNNRENILSGAPWEEIVGYSRAVKIGNLIEISGTTATVNGEIIGRGSVYEQCCCIFDIMEKALQSAGASFHNVVRTRAYITDISLWEEFANAHQQYFGAIKPAATLVEVSKLIHPELLIEIEATAVLALG